MRISAAAIRGEKKTLTRKDKKRPKTDQKKTKPEKTNRKNSPFQGEQSPRKVHLVKLSQVHMSQVQMPDLTLNPEKSLSPNV